jgi:hypothetical protein
LLPHGRFAEWPWSDHAALQVRSPAVALSAQGSRWPDGVPIQ